MLRISQRTINTAARRQWHTTIERRVLTSRLLSGNVKKPSLLAVALTKQPMASMYYGAKRFYNGGTPGQGGQGFKLNPNQEQEQQKPLEQFGIDLTAMAEKGKLDPVIGRDEEIRRTLEGKA
ncbi:uncharacterized protein ATC70_012250 [Mucor velutinosus]|uniref:Uncharacterized protein n=1 Tax=Mucor velutinosus TaxID=708070 RepID=A0AAN7HWU8_9FUNG|nr:hypothetical protein ATC70_012250 [Mucor velutinosus]